MTVVLSLRFDARAPIAVAARIAAHAPDVAARALYTAAMKELVPDMKAQIKANRSVFRGQLHQRTTAASVFDKYNPGVIVGAIGVPYAHNVELGAPPHTADFNKLKDYVRLKLKIRGKKNIAMMAAVLHRSIKRHGTRPHPFIVPVWTAKNVSFLNDFLTRMRAYLRTP